MNTIVRTLPGLPPGLWVPRADEPVDQYRSENFYRLDRTIEDYVDYASFITALLFFTTDKNRVSYMPNKRDINELYDEGYGAPFVRYAKLGGLALVQQSLGFYPRGYEPSEDELVSRLRWLIDYGYPTGNPQSDMDQVTFREIIEWGGARDLMVPYNRLLALQGGSLLSLRKTLGIERRHKAGSLTRLEVMRFMQRVINDHDGPVTRDVMDEEYKDYFLSTPSMVVGWINRRKPISLLWEEFGYVRDSSGMTRDDHIRVGVKTLLANPDMTLTTYRINRLSAEQKHASMTAIENQFGDIDGYRKAVGLALGRYRQVEDNLRQRGISSETLESITQQYRPGRQYEQYLYGCADILVKVSQPKAKYIRSLMRSGFNLLDEKIFQTQLHDCFQTLRYSGLYSPEAINCIFTLIPRITPEDALSYYRQMTSET